MTLLLWYVGYVAGVGILVALSWYGGACMERSRWLYLVREAAGYLPDSKRGLALIVDHVIKLSSDRRRLAWRWWRA